MTGSAGTDSTLAREEDVRRMAAQIDWTQALPPSACGVGWQLQQRVKRLMDFTLALGGLLLLSPLLFLVAVAVVLDSGFPVLYAWRVVGRRGKLFTGYKFRTMVVNADALKSQLQHLNEMQGPVFKMKNDPRLTRLGPALRKYSIDELPQLWSVVIGDMSLVGPRPVFPHEFLLMRPEQRHKLSVIPGITCLWQISGRSSIVDYDEWLRLDMAYIRSWSLWGDLMILLRTIPAVIGARGAH